MKYIKTYEKVQKAMTIEYDDKVFWIIYGDNKIAANVLNTIIENRFSFNNFWVALEGIRDIFNNNTYSMSGAIIYSIPRLAISPVPNYHVFNTYNPKEAKDVVIENYIDKGFKFKGELRVENDEVILDATEANIMKYNL